MNISIIGSGYVGVCTGAGFALKGNKVVFIDIDEGKIKSINSGNPPISEKGLDEAFRKVAKNIKATTNTEDAIESTEITFVCVGTPPMPDGSINMLHVKQAAKEIGKCLRHKNTFHTVVIKSTVVPTTTDSIIKPIIEKESERKSGKDFGLCANPEFLREGNALEDFLNPDRIVVGCSNEREFSAIKNIYKNFNAPIIKTDIKTAEMIKYASNAFLAAKITLINEIGNICKLLGIDTNIVADAIGHDKRIGRAFLNSGVGFGGSCFSKDVSALYVKAKELGYGAAMLKDILEINLRQRRIIVDMLRKRLGTLSKKKIAILGLAFKPGTDDIRDSPSIDVVSLLLSEKADVVAYDPKASANFSKIFPNIMYAKTPKDAIKGADACLVMTDWNEFAKLTDKDFAQMRGNTIIEGRRVLDRNRVKKFEGICW